MDTDLYIYISISGDIRAFRRTLLMGVYIYYIHINLYNYITIYICGYGYGERWGYTELFIGYGLTQNRIADSRLLTSLMGWER